MPPRDCETRRAFGRGVHDERGKPRGAVAVFPSASFLDFFHLFHFFHFFHVPRGSQVAVITAGGFP
jgi:hypothetical protein